MKLHLSIGQTAHARKSYAIPRPLRTVFRRASIDVAKTEIPALADFTLGINFMSDDELLALNIQSLGHDWYTDIITFELERDEESLEAELYISIDRARENAAKAKVSLDDELAHLVVHGVLHLAGYDDHEAGDKKRMRTRERFYLLRLKDTGDISPKADR